MTEIKTNETINVFPCTYILISRAIRPLDHETITKICQQDENFQKRVLDLLINICGSSVYTDIEFQDWSEYEPDKSSNGGCYRFSKHYYYNKDSDLWTLQYETSADMEYCPICGHFGNHEEYDDDTFIGYNITVINTTPHPVTMQDVNGNLISVPTSVLINAKAIEKQVSPLFVKTEFVGTDEGREIISSIKESFNQNAVAGETLVIIGSIIAAQAYPGEVFGLTPVPGYERVAPDDKRMRCDKFTTFA